MMNRRIRTLSLIVAVIVAVALGVGAVMATKPPADVRADYTTVVDAEQAANAASTDADRYVASLQALSGRTEFASRHAPAGWQISDDSKLIAPPSQKRKAAALGIAALAVALGTVAAVVFSRQRSKKPD